MSHLQTAANALLACESAVGALSGEAATKGHYQDARLLLSIAEAIHEQVQNPRLLEKLHSGSKGSTSTAATASGAEDAGSTEKKDPQHCRPSPSQRPARAGPADYPRFSCRNDRLVKTAYSKKNNDEYEHHASRAAAEAFFRHLRKHTRTGQLFTVNDVPPCPDAGGNGELPSYQVYLLLAWLKQRGVARKHGRSGHVVDHDQLSPGALADAWTSLPAAPNPPETSS